MQLPVKSKAKIRQPTIHPLKKRTLIKISTFDQNKHHKYVNRYFITERKKSRRDDHASFPLHDDEEELRYIIAFYIQKKSFQ